MESRELHKLETFKASCLNIKLPKFEGYDSAMDIFTFQSTFEKLYEKRTPKTMLPDLLINNYLEDPALSLVKSVKDISEIWDRLKLAYGDPKSMLKKKLCEINKFTALWKIKEQEKLMEGLSKIINLMKDLTTLAVKHNIEIQLYYSGSIHKIYQLLGENRVTKWLMKISDEDFSDEEQWQKLIQFLEKELRVLQRCLIRGDTKSQNEKDDKIDKRYKSYYQSSNTQLKCSICDKVGHVPTSGPNNSKLIQYFACQDFAMMTPKDRFTLIKNKGLCIQCLSLGARQDQGKHKEGKCQREFIC